VRQGSEACPILPFERQYYNNPDQQHEEYYAAMEQLALKNDSRTRGKHEAEEYSTAHSGATQEALFNSCSLNAHTVRLTLGQLMD
jgi:hypothetical protein